jgi:hypothetical protein
MMLLAGYAPYLPFLALGLVALSQGVGQFEMNIVHKGQINAVPLPVLVPLILALSLVLLLSPRAPEVLRGSTATPLRQLALFNMTCVWLISCVVPWAVIRPYEVSVGWMTRTTITLSVLTLIFVIAGGLLVGAIVVITVSSLAIFAPIQVLLPGLGWIGNHGGVLDSWVLTATATVAGVFLWTWYLRHGAIFNVGVPRD